MPCIYKITNSHNGNIYIGSTTDKKRRWRDHKSLLRTGRHYNKHLQHAWDKYGAKAFSFIVIYEVDAIDSLLDHEQWCIDILEPEYNIASNVHSPMLGRKHTEEAKEKIRRAGAGRQSALAGRALTEEHKKKISEGNKGKKISAEHRRRLSELKKGVPFTEEHKANLRIARNKRSDVANRKLSDTQVREIRRHHRDKTMSAKEMIEKYPVGRTQIYRIINRECWEEI